MAPGHTVHVYPSRQELAHAAACVFVERSREAIGLRGRFAVALAGGSTPRELYRLLGDDDAFRGAVSWPDVQVFWGDERHVPPTHDDSNFRAAREALLDRVPIPRHQVHRIEAESPDAERAALAYEATIRAVFGLAVGAWPSFDLVLLGMGQDGHTASLFPGSATVHERARLVAAPLIETFASHRITLTPPVFAHARAIAVLVAGAEKARTLQEVLEGPLVPDRYPVQCLRESIGTVTWLVDAAAAWLLTPGAHPA
ncbi:MAG: 6-phosphogluconolactonase [Vicinamibacterales bacterium]|nr:6-phosphogluconolactonase [Vicinamibacterales bacterium]